MSKTVGLLIDRWAPQRGGAERALAALARHMGERGHRVLAFGRTSSKPAPEIFRRVRALGFGRVARERALGRRLPQAARAAGCDVTVGVRHLEEVDVYWPHGGAHAAALAARRCARARSDAVPQPELSGRHLLFVELERALLEGGRARRVICVSESVRTELASAWPACRERLVVVENGVDLRRFHPGERSSAGAELRALIELDPRTPLVAFLARDPVLKGLPVLFDALARLRGRPWRLVVAGTRRPSLWFGLARAAGLAAGRVNLFAEADPVALLAAADLVVMPTWRDPFPLVVLEALACGTPVVTTARSGAARLVRAPAAGAVLEDPGDVEALRHALAEWFDRLDGGEPDRDAVRACVAEHDEASWLARLEEIVLAAADE